MKKYYQAVLLGLGRIGYTFEQDKHREKPASHFGIIKSHPRVQLLAGIDPSEKARKRFSKELNPERIFCHYKDFKQSSLLEDKLNSVDILHIASPTHLHLPHLNQALKDKIPLIILEKPVCRGKEDYLECRKIAAKIKKSESIIVVNHERRFSKDYRYVKQNLLLGRWGKLESIDAFFYTNSNKKPLEILMHDGTHLIDLIYYLVPGRLAKVMYLGKNQPKSSLDFYFKKNQVKVKLEINGAKKYFHFELVLNFPSYQIQIGNGIFTIKKAGPSRHYDNFFSLEKVKAKVFPKTFYFSNLYQHAINLLNQKEKTNLSSFEDGMNILRFIKKLKNIK